MRPRSRADEEGAVLVVVLAFMSFFAILIGAVLGFVETGLMTTVQIRDQGHDLYAVDGAMNAAIAQIDHQVILDGADHTFATFDTKVCPAYTVPDLNGNAVQVTCTVHDDSREFIPGGDGVKPGTNTPDHALLVLGGVPGDALTISGNSVFPFIVEGDVSSNVPIQLQDTANLKLQVEGALTARSCEPLTKFIFDPEQFDCPKLLPGFGDPDYDSEPWEDLAVVAPDDLELLRTSDCGRPEVHMPQGIYRDAKELSDFINSRCKGTDTFRFIGVFAFDFDSKGCGGKPLWCITRGDVKIVGGDPLYKDDGEPQRITGCGPDGVQFIFVGESRMEVTDGDVRLCPTPYGEKQRISVFSDSPNCRLQGKCEDLLSIKGPDASMQILGTIYAPEASLNLVINNNSVATASRGIIARSLTLRLQASVGDDPGAIISLPSTAGGMNGIRPAHVVLNAMLGGVKRLEAEVYVDDDRSPADAVTVESWQVRR